MGWLRDFVRKRTKPIPQTHAMKMRGRLSFVYYFTAWNLVILVVIYTLKYHFPETEEDKKYPSKYYARVAGSGDARVIKFSGFKKVGEYEIKGMKRKDPGNSAESRAEADREREEFMKQVHERRRREYLGLPEPAVEDPKVPNEERVNDKSECEDREDLNLLVEETNSL